MKYKQMLKIRKTEKDPQVRDRILLNVLSKPRCAHFATGFGGGSGGILFFW